MCSSAFDKTCRTKRWSGSKEKNQKKKKNSARHSCFACAVSSESDWKKKVLNLCTEGPAGRGPERYPQGQFLPEPSSVLLQITQRCPSHQSQSEDWSQTESIANKEQLSLFSWSRGGRGEQGGMRNGGWGETHSCSVKPKSDRPEML